MNCPLCFHTLTDKKDDVYFECSTCGAWVMQESLRLSPEKEKERYQLHNYNPQDAGYIQYTALLRDKIFQLFLPHHLGLDYGCGPGSVLAHQLKENKYTLHGYDPYFHPDESYKQHTYDYIMCCEVFEHFYQPRSEIEKMLSLLKPGGRIFILTQLYDSVTRFVNWHYRRDPTHVFICSQKTMRFIAQHFNLQLEYCDRVLAVFIKQTPNAFMPE